MSHVFHRNARAAYPVAVAGEGIHLIDADGRRYIDASGGAAVSCLGHGHPRIAEAVRAQLGRLEYAHTSFFTNEPMEALADDLIAHAPEGLERVFFVSGGSEGIEAALKMARQYFIEIGQPQRYRMIARRQSYHGNTLGALAVGGNMLRRRQFDPLLMESHHIAPCYPYREKRSDESEAEYGRRAADELEETIRRLGPETVAAFVAEPVVGATLGAVPPAEGYFRRIREICDRYGVLLICDEVMCGMGRVGALYAIEQEGVRPDLVVIAKGLGAGYQAIGAVLVSGQVYRAFEQGSGGFQHGHTYMGHPVACAAALEVQRVIRDDGLLARVRDGGERLRDALTERFGNHRHVGDIRGRGLFQAIELVSDRSGKEPFDPALAVAARIKREAMARGLLCYPMGGTIDGERGDHVILAPPFIATDAELAEIVARLGDAVDAGIAGASA